MYSECSQNYVKQGLPLGTLVSLVTAEIAFAIYSTSLEHKYYTGGMDPPPPVLLSPLSLNGKDY